MPSIRLPDGKTLTFEKEVTVFEVAQQIGPGLAKATLAGEVDGRLVDASFSLVQDSKLRIITPKDPEGIEIIRHSAAHLLAQATKQLFPSVQVTIGPVIEDGFYYDFAYERSFTPEDLEKIEARMHELAKQAIPVERSEMTREQAIDYFKAMGEDFKVQIIQEIPANEVLSFYRQGDFIDLCRGPHVPNTSFLKAVKLTKLAGAYWRGDAANEMLQRIYGTAWPDKKALADYLHRLEEAEKRDHRRLGKQMHLFHLQEESPGMIFWHPKGWTVYQIVQDYIRQVQKENGYQEVRTPEIVDMKLWQKSGHADKFSDEMFQTDSEKRNYAVKPMNCPCHVQIFNQNLHSYRELPLRLAEFGNCHRNEPSGTLHGIMRVRGFTQDDGHIFCTEDQIQSEVASFIALLNKVYAKFGFHEVILNLSTRPEKRVGSDEDWDKAEAALQQALDNTGMQWGHLPGEGAFYGPKIEFSLKDCLHRVWQCGTMQVDFSMPMRLEAQYVASDGSRKVPVMLHRAMLGSLERFIGILIEHHAGHLPLWLSPLQVVVMNITDEQTSYVDKITTQLCNQRFRVQSDLRNEKIGFKIREHTLQRVPYLVIIGQKELEANQLAVRKQSGEDLGQMSLDDFIQRLESELD